MMYAYREDLGCSLKDYFKSDILKFNGNMYLISMYNLDRSPK